MVNRGVQIANGIKQIKDCDPQMAQVIRRRGPFKLTLEPNRFAMLVRSVLSQQLSTHAAKAIRERVEKLAGGEVSAETMSSLDLQQLRSVGVSTQKAQCIHELSRLTGKGKIDLRQIGRLGNESIIETLTQVRGIGRWTVEMFLIFSLGRLNVLPVDDAGLRNAVKKIYTLPTVPTKSELIEIGRKWEPYATIASWYCWRELDS